jgi:hypothetical protein
MFTVLKFMTDLKNGNYKNWKTSHTIRLQNLNSLDKAKRLYLQSNLWVYPVNIIVIQKILFIPPQKKLRAFVSSWQKKLRNSVTSWQKKTPHHHSKESNLIDK